MFVSYFRCTISLLARCTQASTVLPETKESMMFPRLKWMSGHRAFMTYLPLHKG